MLAEAVKGVVEAGQVRPKPKPGAVAANLWFKRNKSTNPLSRVFRVVVPP